MGFPVNTKQKIKETVGVGRLGLMTHIVDYLFSKPNIPKSASTNRCFLIGTATNGNLGDIAISYAQCKMLRQHYSEVIDIPTGEFWTNLRYLKRIMTADDTVYIQGGGNMGDMYAWHENERCAAMELLPASRFVVFPQTISYDSNSSRLLKYTQKTYNNSHYSVHLFAREHFSYELMKSYYPNLNVKLVPDIVLSLGDDSIFASANKPEERIILTLRDDVEKAIPESVKETVCRVASDNHLTVKARDTYTNHLFIRPNERTGYLTELANEFKTARLIVTDRLHGMVFSALCGVPCIVFGNINHKVKGVYEDWLSDLGYVRFVTDDAMIPSVMNELLELGACDFPRDRFQNKYEELIKLM